MPLRLRPSPPWRRCVCVCVCCRCTQPAQQVFRQLPRHVGFNIELKYPVPCEHERLFHYFPRNTMADIVLNVVYRVAHRRKIIFSSFDPDMCTM